MSHTLFYHCMHIMCPWFPSAWPSAVHIPVEEFNSGGDKKKHGQGGFVWISMDMSLTLRRNRWHNIDSPGPGACTDSHTHMHTAIWTDRQAAASLMGRLKVHG